MTNYISNAFSLAMLDDSDSNVTINSCNYDDIPSDAVSCIGHDLIGKLFDLPVNRVNITLNHGDTLFVLQQTKGRNTDYDNLTRADYKVYRVTV